MQGVYHEEVVACADYGGPRGRRGGCRGGLVGGSGCILLVGAADGDEVECRVGLRVGEGGEQLSVSCVRVVMGFAKKEKDEGRVILGGARRTPELKSRDVPRTQMTTRAVPARMTNLKPRVRATLRPYSSTPTMMSCGHVMPWRKPNRV